MINLSKVNKLNILFIIKYIYMLLNIYILIIKEKCIIIKIYNNINKKD